MNTSVKEFNEAQQIAEQIISWGHAWSVYLPMTGPSQITIKKSGKVETRLLMRWNNRSLSALHLS